MGNFDLILGMDSITHQFQTINYIIDDEANQQTKSAIAELIRENNQTTLLPFNTNVIAEIRTTTDQPIWTKQFPYPMSSIDFVNREIERLLANGIIRPSYSPYNSPIWIVPKDGFNEDGTPKKRLVIDYQKLNSQTIFERYPIPDMNVILSNLGEAQFFSKIDLESGFHQIRIKEEDIEKTGFSVNGAKYEFTRMPFGLKTLQVFFKEPSTTFFDPLSVNSRTFIWTMSSFFQKQKLNIFSILQASSRHSQRHTCESHLKKAFFLNAKSNFWVK